MTTVCCAWRWQRARRAGSGSRCRCATAVGGVLPLAVPQRDAARRRARRRAPRRPARRAAGRRRAPRRPGRCRSVATGAVLLVGPAAAGRRPCSPRVVVVAAGALAGRRAGVAAVAAAGHVLVFLVAARAAGTDASLAELLPLALAGAARGRDPAQRRGLGPREGWPPGRSRRPGSARRRARRSRSLYGVLALVATLPGGRARWPTGRERSVAERPYTLLSCGMSIDGYLDGAGDERLILSNDADLDRVDAVRAECDAILVGAATVRNDNPRLLVRCPERRLERVARGLQAVAGQGDGDLPGRARPGRPVLHDRRLREARLLPSGARRRRRGPGSARSRPSSTAGRGSRCARLSEDLHDARRTPADGRGRRHHPHPVPHRGPRRRAAAGGRAVLRRRLRGPPLRRRRPRSRSARAARPGWPTYAGSARSCCCATRCPTGSRRRRERRRSAPS